MKKIITLTMGALLALGLTACSSKNEQIPEKVAGGECVISGEEAPLWACGGHEINGKYVAVGSAPMSKLGHQFSRNEAILNGRTNLVNIIELDIKTKADSYMRSAGLNSNELVEKVVTQMTKQTSNLTLKESKQLSYWQHPENNEIFVLVGVDKGNFTKQIEVAVKEVVPVDTQIANSEDALNKLQ